MESENEMLNDVLDIEYEEVKENENEIIDKVAKPVKKPKLSIQDFLDKNNITDELSEDKLNEIGKECLNGYKIDLNHAISRNDKIRELYNLAIKGKDDKFTPRFNDSSDVCFPLIMKAALEFVAIAKPAIIKDDAVVKGKVIGDDNEGEELKDPVSGEPLQGENGVALKTESGALTRSANNMAKFMSYYLLNKVDVWVEDNVFARTFSVNVVFWFVPDIG
jgi:hypothetical protein